MGEAIPVVAASNPRALISDSVRSTYERDGVVALRNAFADYWVAFLRAAIERAMADPGPHADNYSGDGRGGFFVDVEVALRLPELDRFARESPAAEIAARCRSVGRVMTHASVSGPARSPCRPSYPPELAHGDVLAGERFPLVWTADQQGVE